MSKSLFVLPDGVKLSVQNGRVSVVYDGDVVLEQGFAGDVNAAGHIVVNGDAGGSLQSSADIQVTGAATGGDLRARRRITIAEVAKEQRYEMEIMGEDYDLP